MYTWDLNNTTNQLYLNKKEKKSSEGWGQDEEAVGSGAHTRSSRSPSFCKTGALCWGESVAKTYHSFSTPVSSEPKACQFFHEDWLPCPLQPPPECILDLGSVCISFINPLSSSFHFPRVCWFWLHSLLLWLLQVRSFFYSFSVILMGRLTYVPQSAILNQKFYPFLVLNSLAFSLYLFPKDILTIHTQRGSLEVFF